MTQRKKAARLALIPVKGINKPQELTRAKTALRVCALLKPLVKRGRVRHPLTGDYRDALVVQIPRRQFERAQRDGLIKAFLCYRIFNKNKYSVVYLSGRDDWVREQVVIAQEMRKAA